ncbi:tumor necrosis factor receptor superfamily member 9a [Pygocentrus nattereri]|uniref:TNFR-Cys domain-containing protein n=1 Tax=Pygocentrus nattereri TaxID=42514 RepID=A0A3B4E9I0_PYGNA|nr:tumor necrosis factor receptor superfamily member 9a [Pygocentrus nattereri]
MHLKLWNLSLVLLIASMFHTSVRTENGCADWLSSEVGICCQACHPGNRLVEKCGPDRFQLCKPCDPGTFTTSPLKKFCNRCTQCIGPRVVVKNCTPSSDTVCDCKPGFRCGNSQCSYCVDECKKGEEPTTERTCRKCPQGTFNDQIHSKCTPRRTRCPDEQELVSISDPSLNNECKTKASTLATARTTPLEYNTVEPLQTTKKKKDDTFWPVVGVTGSIFLLTCAFILALWFAYQRAKNTTNTETKDLQPETLPPEELRVMIMEHDDACSFRQPEQEQGGSSESLSTQDSESKLIL